MNLIIVACKRCQINPVTIPESMSQYGGMCEECINSENHSAQVEVFRDKQADAWESICPVRYSDTVIDKLPQKEVSERALNWPNVFSSTPEKSAPWIGLNLWGFPGTGKTRTMLLVLKKAHFDGKRVRFFGPSQFAQEIEMRDFKTASWIRAVMAYDVIAFDDLDKCKLTRPQEEKFFALLDARFSARKPMFFTGNSSGADLKTMFRNGEAVVRRIRESCVSIHFPQQQQLKL